MRPFFNRFLTTNKGSTKDAQRTHFFIEDHFHIIIVIEYKLIIA